MLSAGGVNNLPLMLLTRWVEPSRARVARRLATEPPGLAAMQHLMQAGEATPTELSRRLGVSTAAMMLVLDRLANAGHITRQPHPTDRRKVVINPDTATVTAARTLVDPLTAGVEMLIASLEPHERETVWSFLDGMLCVYDEVLDSDDFRGGPATRPGCSSRMVADSVSQAVRLATTPPPLPRPSEQH